MVMMKKLWYLIGFVLVLTSCAELGKLAKQMEQVAANLPPSEQENISGIKSALDIGIQNAVKNLTRVDGFMGDQLVKILLPPEAKPIADHIKLIPGGEKLLNDFILLMNRSAEDAVKQATPIFANAIRSMTISDALGILRGGENAATQYLRRNTENDLQQAFQPRIKTSLNKKLVGNVSASQSWKVLADNYNKLASSAVGRASNLKPVNVNLEVYVTQKALDGIFIKVADEERLIRKNPSARVNDLLRKVFGQLD